MQDALLSDVSLAMLAGSSVKTGADEAITVVGRETHTIREGKVVLKETGNVTNVTVMESQSGVLTGEELDVVNEGGELTITGADDGQEVMVFFEYQVTSADVTKVTFSANNYPATYRVVGDTFGRGQDGIDRKMQFVIPQAKLQSTFSLTMDVENVSVFDFNLDVLVEAGTNRMYDIIRL